jgi:hypothetical protein
MTALVHQANPVRVSAGPTFRAEIHRPCGHIFKDTAGWNSEGSAREYGLTLLALACGTCNRERKTK